MVTNVDSVESMNDGVIIQVLGELSNDGAPSQKFAETFFLASQPPNGYFVLNDIFRYIKEDIESDYDDGEPDSANEIESSVPHDNSLGSDRLTNGFHTTASPVPAEDAVSISTPLPVSSAPVASPSDSHVVIDQMTHLSAELQHVTPDHEDSSTAPEILPDGLGTQHSDSQSAVQDQERSDGTSQLISQPEDSSVSGTAEPVNVSATRKTWATLAAKDAEKWHAPPAQKPATAGTPPPPKGNAIQSVPRREAQKSFHQGTSFYILPLCLYIRETRPGIGLH
jgi:Nuclear transport factor 2 (NTF2) domain